MRTVDEAGAPVNTPTGGYVTHAHAAAARQESIAERQGRLRTQTPMPSIGASRQVNNARQQDVRKPVHALVRVVSRHGK